MKDNASHRFQVWGNSVLYLNAKQWTCIHCGHLIKNNIPFSVLIINGSLPKIFCSNVCLKNHIAGLDTSRHAAV